MIDKSHFFSSGFRKLREILIYKANANKYVTYT